MYSDELSFGAVDLNGIFFSSIEQIHSQFEEVRIEIKKSNGVLQNRERNAYFSVE